MRAALQFILTALAGPALSLERTRPARLGASKQAASRHTRGKDRERALQRGLHSRTCDRETLRGVPAAAGCAFMKPVCSRSTDRQKPKELSNSQVNFTTQFFFFSSSLLLFIDPMAQGRRAGAALAGGVLVVVLVATVGYRSPSGDGKTALLGSSSILARAETEARSAKALAHGAGVSPTARRHGQSAQAGPAENKARELRNEMKDMEDMKNIRTYSGGGGKILAEAKKEEKTLKALADLSAQRSKRRQKLEDAHSPAVLKEGAPKATEHALAREEELSDCAPFCDPGAQSQSRKEAHEKLQKEQARQRMERRAKLRRAKEEEQEEEQAHCLFCKPAASGHDRAKRGAGALLDNNLLKGLKDSDLDAKTGKLQMPSLHQAQGAGRQEALVARPQRKLTIEDHMKISRAADQIAAMMHSDRHDSRDVDREMAKMDKTGKLAEEAFES